MTEFVKPAVSENEGSSPLSEKNLGVVATPTIRLRMDAVQNHIAEYQDAISLHHDGSTIITPRQHLIVYGVATGISNDQIAESMGISDQTIKNHLHFVFKNHKIHTRDELLALGYKNGLINPDNIEAGFDYGRYSLLTQKRHELFNNYTQETSYLAKDIAESSYTTIATLKNNTTLLLRDLQLKNREQIRLFAEKRKRMMSQKQDDEITLTADVHLGMIKRVAHGVNTSWLPKDILGQFDARTLEEAVGHGLAYGVFTHESLGLSPIPLEESETIPQYIWETIRAYGAIPGNMEDRLQRLQSSPTEVLEHFNFLQQTLGIKRWQATVLAYEQEVIDARKEKKVEEPPPPAPVIVEPEMSDVEVPILEIPTQRKRIFIDYASKVKLTDQNNDAIVEKPAPQGYSLVGFHKPVTREEKLADIDSHYDPEIQSAVINLRNGTSEGRRVSWTEISERLELPIYEAKVIFLRAIKQRNTDSE